MPVVSAFAAEAVTLAALVVTSVATFTQALWRQLGYRVVPVPGFTTTAMYGGALRCSVKVLARNQAM